MAKRHRTLAAGLILLAISLLAMFGMATSTTLAPIYTQEELGLASTLGWWTVPSGKLYLRKLAGLESKRDKEGGALSKPGTRSAGRQTSGRSAGRSTPGRR